MSDNVIEWLLEEDNPSVRFFTLTSLLQVSLDDQRVVQTRENIQQVGVVPEILARQNEDGSWGDPARFYTDKYTGTSWTLLILAELAADPSDTQIKKSCEFVLEHSRDPLSGAFSHTRSVKTGEGLPGGIIPCLTSNMVYALIKFGYLHDPRVQKALAWIVDYQRADDAIKTPPEGAFYKRYEVCWGRHSCHMGVAKALKALTAIPPEYDSPEIIAKRSELAEYFLKHHIYKKSHDLSKVSRPGWLKFGFPLMYQTDVLELLEMFAELKINDPRPQDAIEILKGKQQQDGRWKLESSNNGKMLVNIEKKGAPSKWITLKALKVLEFYR